MSLFDKTPIQRMIEGSHTTYQRNRYVNDALDKAMSIVRTELGNDPRWGRIVSKIQELKHDDKLIQFPPPNKNQSLK